MTGSISSCVFNGGLSREFKAEIACDIRNYFLLQLNVRDTVIAYGTHMHLFAQIRDQIIAHKIKSFDDKIGLLIGYASQIAGWL